MEEKTTGGNGLAIASFVLALVGGFFCITLIGLPLGILCWILALIFGIVALCKKQTKWASILGIVLSLLGAIIVAICTTAISKFVVQHKDEFVNPINEFSARIEENPEIAKLMEDEDFSDKYEAAIKERLQEKYGTNYSDINSIDGFMDIWGDMFEEMKNVATELAGEAGMGLDQGNEEPTLGIANPAAEFCVAQGGKSYIVEDEDGAQRGMCRLADGSEIDEWEYYNTVADVTSDVFQSVNKETCEKIGGEMQTFTNDEGNDYEMCILPNMCDESYKSGEEIVCTEQYAPVCGNDGKTYGNSCFACIEVDSYTDGECAE